MSLELYFAHANYIADLDDAVREINEAGYDPSLVLPDAVYSHALPTPTYEEAVRLAHRNLKLEMHHARSCM